MSETTNKDDALLYAQELGWRVFPIYEIGPDGRCACGKDCSSPGKHPRTRNGVKDASSDPLQVSAWWNAWPWANIAIATGFDSGVVVVDLDVKPDKGIDGVASWAALGIETSTLEARSGSGVGRHLFFAAPDFARIKNSASLIAPGIDTRGEGGYLLVAPSNHLSGGMYEWLNGNRLARYPDALVELTRAGPGHTGTTGTHGVPSNAPGRYGPGQRNDALTRVAGVLRAKGMTEAPILSALLTENEIHCDPPLPQEEVENIARSICRYKPGQYYAFTEKGNSERLVHLFGDRFRWVTTWKRWLVWDERRWSVIGADVAMKRFGLRTIEFMHVESTGADLEKEFAQKLAKWARSCEKRAMITNMVELANAQPGVALHHDDLDKNPMLLNVLNGTLDLETGNFRTHSSSEMVTQLAGVEFNPEAECPVWERFVYEICGEDPELVGYLQRAVGYSLTGRTDEHALFFCHGRGANGKSTFLNAILAMLGEYGRPGAPGLLLEKRGSDPHPTGQANLHGARLVSCQEVDENRSWDEPTVKQLTGGDLINARRMGEDFWHFNPTHKLWVSGNTKPYVRDSTDGIWRRMRLIPFMQQFKGDRDDKTLKTRIAQELTGILNWSLLGCFDWQERGLDPPQSVLEATEAYREEQDVIAPWFEECALADPEARTPRKSAYQSFVVWAGKTGAFRLSERRFATELRARGFEEYKQKGVRGWLGLAIKNSAQHRMFEGI